MNTTKELLHEIIKECIKENLKVVVETGFNRRYDARVVEVKLFLSNNEFEFHPEIFTSSSAAL